MAALVPFGKYKGQPVEMLAADREYCEWLVSQDWFRTKFIGIHTLIVNHLGAPAETPEHNALQVRFLEADWCQRFALCNSFKAIADGQRQRALRGLKERIPGFERDVAHSKADLERAKASLPASGVSWYEEQLQRTEGRYVMACEELQRLPTTDWWFDASAECEVRGVDVVVDVSLFSRGLFLVLFESPGYITSSRPRQFEIKARYAIECKPTLGDDYPAVLRQMKANDSGYLVIGEFRATAVSYEQVSDVFERSDITVLTVAAIEQQSLVWA